MLDSTKPSRLKDGQLLEFTEDGKVISASEWNAVMNNLKTVINQNASVLSTSKSQPSSLIIKPSDWHSSNSDPNSFYYDITKSMHGIDGFCTVHTYDANLNSVLLNTHFDSTTKTVRLKSRLRVSLVVLLQGVGAQ